ncbi:hypothetical protein F2P79_013733 [Pimephales promelas]|nr:hypothetical protein F2P79_013733 [Pimephales promelas]
MNELSVHSERKDKESPSKFVTIRKLCLALAISPVSLTRGPMEKNEEIGEEKHHVKTEEKTSPQTESISSLKRDKKYFICHQCGKSFTQQGRLRNHMVIHTGETQHKCDQCGLMEKNEEIGEEKHHVKTEEKTPSQTESVSSLKRDKKYFICHKCGKRFTQQGRLRNHMIIHTGLMEKNEESEDEKHHVKTEEKTSLQTESISSLKIDKKYFICHQCGKSFKKQGRLKKHMIIHTGETLHKCDQCGHVKSHERIHTGEKPYHCTPCGKSFTQTDDGQRKHKAASEKDR